MLDMVLASVFSLHFALAVIVVLSAYAAGSRGLVPGIVTGIAFGAAVILGDFTVGQELLDVTLAEMKDLIIVAAAGASLGTVVTALMFEPGEPESTDKQTDPTTYTNR